MNKCLGCYQPLKDAPHDGHYHHSCSKKLFGTENPPAVDFGVNDLEELAKKSISQHLGVTGVQPKISLHIEKKETDPSHRLMIVDLWGNFILKPPTNQFPDMSVVEDATMHMAELVGLETARHGLIQLKSGELAYVTKRFDRPKKGKKIAVEDFCQLSELLTESKYDTSTEKAGKIILKYSSQPGLDAVTFFDLNLFCFVTGNADMHLKNFSLMRNDSGEMVLSPAYDLLSTRLLMAEDKEEVALTINGKKARIKREDFIALGKNLQIPDKAIGNSFARIAKHIPEMKRVIDSSFLNDDMRKLYNKLIDDRAKLLF
ncbi:MAG: HipA domain-containing protein [Proteobacteria bacterium]|jgi:serine/threonine-protein kinase HipA|nr:HipA domain-containing protein [Pseudomonadota bacterium]